VKDKEIDKPRIDKPRDGGRESRAGASLRTILDSMVEAVYVTDEGGRVILANAALEALIARDVRGQRAKNVIKSKELKLAIRRARKKNEATEVELETVVGDRMRTFQAQVAPLPEGAGVVTVLHDVTSLKNADRVRRDFVANASHELRTPLTAIRGFAETLRDGALDEAETARRFVDRILDQCRRLQLLLDDLLTLSRLESLEAAARERRPVDLARVVERAVETVMPRAAERRVEIVVDAAPDLPQVAGDADALERLIANLLDNAVKYNQVGGRVSVELAAGRAGETMDAVVLTVADTGLGIPAHARDRIFERFYRVDRGRARDEGGTGLGLAIVKHVVQSHGGSIEVDARPGGGSLFRVRLPGGVR
jgi:two-component system phosphate regulon sensor histidine kinase PhoR